MKSKKEADVRVRLTTELKKEFNELCEKEFINTSVKIRQLIGKYVKEENEKKSK